MLRNPIQSRPFGISIVGTASVFIAMSLVAQPASAACMPGGPCISVSPYHLHGMGGGGGMDMGGMLGIGGALLGQALGNAIAESQNQQVQSDAHSRSVALNNEGVNYDKLGDKYFKEKNYQRAIEAYNRAISLFRQSLKLEPNDKIVLKNIAASQVGMLSAKTWLTNDVAELIDLHKQILRYRPGDKKIQESIAKLEQRQLYEQRQARLAEQSRAEQRQAEQRRAEEQRQAEQRRVEEQRQAEQRQAEQRQAEARQAEEQQRQQLAEQEKRNNATAAVDDLQASLRNQSGQSGGGLDFMNPQQPNISSGQGSYTATAPSSPPTTTDASAPAPISPATGSPATGGSAGSGTGVASSGAGGPAHPSAPPTSQAQIGHSPSAQQLQGMANKGEMSGPCFDGAINCAGTSIAQSKPSAPPVSGGSTGNTAQAGNIIPQQRGGGDAGNAVPPAGSFAPIPIVPGSQLASAPSSPPPPTPPQQRSDGDCERVVGYSTPTFGTGGGEAVLLDCKNPEGTLAKTVPLLREPEQGGPVSSEVELTGVCKGLGQRIAETRDWLTRAILSNDVYNGRTPRGFTRVSGDLEKMRKLLPGATDGTIKELTAPDNSDYRADIYRDDKSGRYFLAFRGTQSILDWKEANIPQQIGKLSEYYSKAMALAQLLKKNVGIDKFEIVGHSTGGGMAHAAGLATGARATGFNASGVHPKTVEGKGQLPGTENLVDVVVRGEILTTLQDNRDPIKRQISFFLASHPGIAIQVGAAVLTKKLTGVSSYDSDVWETLEPDSIPQGAGRRITIEPTADDLRAASTDPTRLHLITSVVDSLVQREKDLRADLAAKECTPVNVPAVASAPANDNENSSVKLDSGGKSFNLGTRHFKIVGQ